VGVSIGVERIFAILEAKAEGEIRGVDCFVASVGKDMLVERMKVMRRSPRDTISLIDDLKKDLAFVFSNLFLVTFDSL
jgi:histidyl-tRNA synthetase